MRSLLRHHRVGGSPIVVAIPARDEAERLNACLRALDTQDRPPDIVVLLLNNCNDASEHIARQLVKTVHYNLVVESRTLPEATANAGEARRIAMLLAAAHAGVHGIVMTTDADGTVPANWISRSLIALNNGADLVCGRVMLDPAESTVIPARLHADDARECELIALLDEIAWAVDPDPADPWPRHTEEAGASLAMTASALARVGGVPVRLSGEDRALVQAVRRIDGRVRHDQDIVVTVSGRIDGRAPGGMADTIRRRIICQDILTDEQVEPAQAAWRRVMLRARLRSAWSRITDDSELAKDLGLAHAAFAEAVLSRWFGEAWHIVQERSPVLHRQRVRFVDLPAEIVRARRILARIHPPHRAAGD